jgi:hypothetical protein
MTAGGASVVQRSARRLSPLLFIITLIGFFLAFAGVSCNSDAAKALLGTVGQGVATDSRQVAEINGCLSSVNGFDLVTYRGIDLASGAPPAVTSTLPAGCAGLGPDTQAIRLTVLHARVSLQPLMLLALLVTAGGVVVSAVYFVRRPRSRALGLVPALLSAIALGLVLVEQFAVLGRQVSDRISAASASQTSSRPVRIDLGDYFRVTPGLGFAVIVTALVVEVLWALAGAASGRRRRQAG